MYDVWHGNGLTGDKSEAMAAFGSCGWVGSSIGDLSWDRDANC